MSSSNKMVFVLCCLTYCTFALAVVNEGTFYHISDIHYDPYYGNGVYPSSSCRIPINAEEQLRGSYDCDSPWKLVFEAIGWMSSSVTGKTDFVVWTGDTPATLPQDVLNKPTLLDIFQNVSQQFQYSLPAIPVFTSIGNYDNYPINVNNPEPTPFRDALAAKWDAWFNTYPGAKETFKNGGYYVTPIRRTSGLWMIVLNTAMYDVANIPGEETEDPAGQFAWLENTLRYAEGNGTKVYISGHTPPGSLEREEKVTFRPNFNQRYLEIIRAHHHVIKGQFFGHNQYDSFRIIYDDEGMPINALYIQPALTPRGTPAPRNPSVRTVTYDRDTGDVIDIRQHYLDLTNPASSWGLEYAARKTYGVIPDLSPQSLHDLVEEFSQENSTTFQRYYEFNNVKFANASECDAACKRGHICAITKLDIEDFENCIAGRNEDETTTGSSIVTPDDDDDDGDDGCGNASGDGRRARGSLISNALLFLVGFMLIEMYQ